MLEACHRPALIEGQKENKKAIGKSELWLSAQNAENQGAGMIKVTWFDNYFVWLERLVKKLQKWIEEQK